MRVLVCDDHVLMVRILAEHLVREGFDVVTAESPERALEQQQAAPADICVLDLRFGNSALDGAQTLTRLRALTPGLRVLLLSSHPDSAVAGRALVAGADALLDKKQPMGLVTQAVRRLAAGGQVVPCQPTPAQRRPAEQLSARERQVLTMLVRGCSTTQVATLLGISVHTVRKHVQRLLHKLGVRTRLEAIALATRDGLVLGQEQHDPAERGRNHLAGAR